MSKKTALALVSGVVLVGAAAAFLWPKSASAAVPMASDESAPPPGDYPEPKSVGEAADIGMSTSTTDADYVQFLADWVNRTAPGESAISFSLQRRAYALKAEVLLGEGLKQSTDLDRVLEISNQLQGTHPAYSALLAMRIAVQQGKVAPPARSTMQLLSGGSLLVDLAPYAPLTGGGGVSPSVAPSVSVTVPAVAPMTVARSAPASVVTSTPTVVTSSGVTVPVVVPPNAPPLVAEEIKPANDPNGTILLARILLEEQGKPGWKYVSEAVKEWQSKVGLTADGKFGPGSAVKMAEEVAILPFVRYWPTGSASKSSAVNAYRGRLKAYAVNIAPKRREHALMLIRAADLETGQGWPTKPAVAPAQQPTVAEVEAAKAVLAKLGK